MNIEYYKNDDGNIFKVTELEDKPWYNIDIYHNDWKLYNGDLVKILTLAEKITEKEINENIISLKSVDFIEEEHPRDNDGQFSSKPEKKKFKEAYQQTKLEELLPRKDFNMDWIENKIKNKDSLTINSQNLEKSVNEYAKLSFAVQRLGNHLKSVNKKSEKFFIAKRIEKYLEFREVMIPQIEKAVDNYEEVIA